MRVGVAGWSYEDWNGIVYPKPRPARFHPLTLLSTWFDTVEVNACFYRPIAAATAAGWPARVEHNPRFRFTAKLWQRFTHERQSLPTAHEVEQYLDGIRPLRQSGLLGALLAQFPWSFRRTPAAREWLAWLTETFTGWPLAIELRHTSWDVPAFYDGLAARGLGLCTIDQPLLGDCLPPDDRTTAPLGYVRFHGRRADTWFREDVPSHERYNYLYSQEELAPWLERLEAMRARTRALYVVNNNHFQGKAVANALQVQAALAPRALALPRSLVNAFPDLAKLAQSPAKAL